MLRGLLHCPDVVEPTALMQVLVAAANPPTKYFNFFLTSLLETVRLNIGECAAAAYSHLSIAAATKLLMFEHEDVRQAPV